MAGEKELGKEEHGAALRRCSVAEMQGGRKRAAQTADALGGCVVLWGEYC